MALAHAMAALQHVTTGPINETENAWPASTYGGVRSTTAKCKQVSLAIPCQHA